MAIKTIGIVGAGQMGSGIAQVAATSHFDVIMSDISEALVERGKSNISTSLDRMVQKEKITPPQKRDIMDRIEGTIDIGKMKGADFIIEAATENEGLKLSIFKKEVKKERVLKKSLIAAQKIFSGEKILVPLLQCFQSDPFRVRRRGILTPSSL